MNILGIKIDNFSKKDVLEKVKLFCNSEKQYKIFTPNPEMIVDAQKDKYFKEVLNGGDINICDGKGIQLVSAEKLERIAGTDFVQDICELSENLKKSIYLLGSTQEILKKTKEKFKKDYPELDIAGFSAGPHIKIIDEELKYVNSMINEATINDINLCKPDILLVAFGHNKQEKWISEHLKMIPSVKVAIGVGGAFDYLSGSVKRAPEWMRTIGFEWLYRLIIQPKRFGRILKATIVFMYLIIKNRIKI